MATTKKKATSARKPAVKKAATSNNARGKFANIADRGTETDMKTKYHFMCVVTMVFALLCGVLFIAFCTKQSDFEDLRYCYAEDANCALPNKRAESLMPETTSYYESETVIENAISAAGQE